VLYGRAWGLGRSEAEDVLQDTFLALVRLPRAPDDPGHYARRSYRNRARNTWRGLWRRLARESESRHWFEPEPDQSDSERGAMRALAQLPVAQREVIVLKIWHRLTFEEIGRLVGVPTHTAAGRYRYGLQKLRMHAAEIQHELAEPVRDPVGWLAAPSAIPET